MSNAMQQTDSRHSPGSSTNSSPANRLHVGTSPQNLSPPNHIDAPQGPQGLPIPPIRVQSETPCPPTPSNSQTPAPQQVIIKQEMGVGLDKGGYRGNVETLPALSSTSCAVTNGKPPEILKNRIQGGGEGYSGDKKGNAVCSVVQITRI